MINFGNLDFSSLDEEFRSIQREFQGRINEANSEIIATRDKLNNMRWEINQAFQISQRDLANANVQPNGSIIFKKSGQTYIITNNHIVNSEEKPKKKEKEEIEMQSQRMSEYDRIVKFYSTCKAKTKLEEEQEALGYDDWLFEKYLSFKKGESDDWLILMG